MSEYNELTFQRVKKIGLITLNRPNSRNALNRKLRLELISIINEANNDDEIRVVVITGAGNGFCAGADLTEKLEGSGKEYFTSDILRNEYNPIILAIYNAPKPYISAVNGAAAGIGSAIAMACDLMIMDDNAYLYSAFAMISLIPDGACHKFFLSMLGSKKAYEMIAFSQRISAEKCLSFGIANRVVAHEDLLESAIEWADELAEQAPLTLQFSKQLLHEAASVDIEEMMFIEAKYQNMVKQSDDYQEGVTAFFEKRKAHFTGK